MKIKKKLALCCVSLMCSLCFAKQTLDDVLIEVSKDVAARCEPKEIIAVMDFSSGTEEMGSY